MQLNYIVKVLLFNSWETEKIYIYIYIHNFVYSQLRGRRHQTHSNYKVQTPYTSGHYMPLIREKKNPEKVYSFKQRHMIDSIVNLWLMFPTIFKHSQMIKPSSLPSLFALRRIKAKISGLYDSKNKRNTWGTLFLARREGKGRVVD